MYDSDSVKQKRFEVREHHPPLCAGLVGYLPSKSHLSPWAEIPGGPLLVISHTTSLTHVPCIEQNDWERAMKMGIVKVIMRMDDDHGEDEVRSHASTSHCANRHASSLRVCTGIQSLHLPSSSVWLIGAVQDGDGMPDEVAEVSAALWHAHDLIDLNFDYFAATSSGFNVSMLTLNDFSRFCSESGITSRSKKSRCRQSDIDMVFIQVDAAASRLETEVTSDVMWSCVHGHRHGHPHAHTPHGHTRAREHTHVGAFYCHTALEYAQRERRSKCTPKCTANRHIQPGGMQMEQRRLIGSSLSWRSSFSHATCTSTVARSQTFPKYMLPRHALRPTADAPSQHPAECYYQPLLLNATLRSL